MLFEFARRSSNISPVGQGFVLIENYLDIQCLVPFGCKTIANMPEGKCRKRFVDYSNLILNVTSAEEEQTRCETAYARSFSGR